MPRLLLLPAQTSPADTAFARRHSPHPIQKDYAVFRECLRWEFGFTCAICLLHERDVVKYSVEGWGVTQIEHLVARSHDESIVGVYTNVIYICKLCNVARSDTEHEDNQGRRLLDPTKTIWAQHFYVKDDELLPFAGDVHADYTADTYNMNDPRKVKLRRLRREKRSDLAALLCSQREDTAGAVDPHTIARIQKNLDRLYRLLSEYAWIPDDAPQECRCGLAPARSLPIPYLRQVVEIDMP